MARRFRKKAGFGAVVLPGLPGLGTDVIVEGDEYAKFCPAILEEVFDAAPSKVTVEKPVAVPPPPPPPPAEPEPESELEADEGTEAEPPNMDWLKSELVEYAEGLGLQVDGMTKAQILDAIESEEGE